MKGSSESNKKKKRKYNQAEDVDVDSDEQCFKDKVFDRYISNNLTIITYINFSFTIFTVMKIQT